MKIISWNTNGLRSIYRKNFLEWLGEEKPDVVCLQEIKVDLEHIPNDLLNLAGYSAIFNSALKKGYAGVGIYTKVKPLNVKKEIGFKQFDSEGRYLELDFGDWILINTYLPHGGRQKEKLPYKLQAYEHLVWRLQSLKDRKVILAGDFNIAHSELDLARPKSNTDNIMFTPEERAQIDLILQLGFLDTFRQFNKEGGYYTWWPYRNNARERNIGWRIDYIFASQSTNQNLVGSFIQHSVLGSDHCPVGVEIRLL